MRPSSLTVTLWKRVELSGSPEARFTQPSESFLAAPVLRTDLEG